jgi:hypothetical protein
MSTRTLKFDAHFADDAAPEFELFLHECAQFFRRRATRLERELDDAFRANSGLSNLIPKFLRTGH